MLHSAAHAERDRNSGLRRRPPTPAQTTQAGAQADRQAALGWTLVLRRQPARIGGGEPQGYTDLFELICCDCGDDPDLDYHHVSPRIQQIRGPYPVAAGIAVYEQHARRHQGRPLKPWESSAAGDAADVAGWMAGLKTPRRLTGGSAGHPYHRSS
jgi:hypothetical protein